MLSTVKFYDRYIVLPLESFVTCVPGTMSPEEGVPIGYDEMSAICLNLFVYNLYTHTKKSKFTKTCVI